jgi:hypothetical protein
MNLGRMALAGRGATAKAAARNVGFKLRIDCGYNSLVVGKNAGNFGDLADFSENTS